MLFDCCNVCQRVYRDPGGAFYLGRCLRAIRFAVGTDRTAARTFIVG